MKWLSWICAILIAGHLALVIFANRALYTIPFDQAYWKDKYEQSQWVLPRTIRTIGDDGLYLYEGWRLVHGADPTSRNAEAPPLGKYLIGTSLLFLKNGPLYGLVVTSLVIGVFFLLAHALLQNLPISLLATALVLLDPMITSQFPLTMLDSLQLLFLLLFLLTMTLFQKAKTPRAHMVLASAMGIILGLFSATKVALFGPLLALIGSYVMWKRTRRAAFLAALIGLFIATYVLAYTQFFLLGHGIIDWLKIQKWILSFYRHESAVPNYASVFSTLLINQYQNLFTGAMERVGEWTLAWPIVTILALWGIGVARRKPAPEQRSRWFPTEVTTVAILGAYALIAFWTRYLVLLLPLLYLSAVRVIATANRRALTVLACILIATNAMASGRILFPTPEVTLRQLTYDWQYGFFQDIYEHLATGARQQQDRWAFHRFGQRVLHDAEIERTSIEVVKPATSRSRSPQEVVLRVTYFTRNLGPFTQTTTVSVVKEDGQWRIPWQWDNLIDGLTLETHLQTSVEEGRRGSIIAGDGTVYARDFPSFMIWVTPKDLDTSREQELLTLVSDLFELRLTPVNIHQRYSGNRQSDWPVPIGVLPRPLDEETMGKLTSFPGVGLTPNTGRSRRPSTVFDVGIVTNSDYFECCSSLYSTTTYDGYDGVEKAKNDLLKGHNGGSLILKDEAGFAVRTLIRAVARDGVDIQP